MRVKQSQYLFITFQTYGFNPFPIPRVGFTTGRSKGMALVLVVKYVASRLLASGILFHIFFFLLSYSCIQCILSSILINLVWKDRAGLFAFY